MNPTVDGQQWLVLINQDTRRMMSTREVQTEVLAGVLPRETLVWRAGMSAWQSIASIHELAGANTRPTVPRAKAPAGWDVPLAATQPAHHGQNAHHGHNAQHGQSAQHGHGAHAEPRRSAPNPQLMLELVATAAAVSMIVLITTYTLYAGGAFQAGGGPHGSGAHETSAEPKTASH